MSAMLIRILQGGLFKFNARSRSQLVRDKHAGNRTTKPGPGAAAAARVPARLRVRLGTRLSSLELVASSSLALSAAVDSGR